MVGYWIIAAGLTAAFAVILSLTLIPAYGRATMDRFARSVGLAVPGELRGAIRRRLMLRQRTGGIGALIATILTALLGASAGYGESTWGTFFLIAGAFGGIAVGIAVAATVYGSGPDGERVRVARSGAVDLRDYVAPVERNGARVVVTTAVLFTVVVYTVSLSSLRSDQPVVLGFAGSAMTVLSVVALLFFELAGRRIVHRAQPAGSPAELAWDDALRSSLVRDLVTPPMLLGLYGVLVGTMELSSAVVISGDGPHPEVVATNLALGVICITVVVGGLYAISRRPERHFLRRLWPEVAAQLNGPAHAHR